MNKFLRLTRNAPGQLDSNGLERLHLGLHKDGSEVASIGVYSGAPGHQNFRKLADQVEGRLEPIPEGTYSGLGLVEWAGGYGDWDARFPSIESPVWMMIYPERAIGFHLDGNAGWAPGSAGCVVCHTLDDLHTLVSWWSGLPPSELVVDHGLGTIK